MLKLWLGFVQRLWYRDGGESQVNANTCTVVAEWRRVPGPEAEQIDPQIRPRDAEIFSEVSAATIDDGAKSIAGSGNDARRFMLAQRLQSVMVLNRAKRRPEEAVDAKARVAVRRTFRVQRRRRIVAPVTLKPAASAQTFRDNVIVFAAASNADGLKRAA